MGLLDIYDKQILNPEPITSNYFYNMEDEWAIAGMGVYYFEKTIRWIVKNTEENRKLFKCGDANFSSIINAAWLFSKDTPFEFKVAKVRFSYYMYTRTLKREIRDRNIDALVHAIGYRNAHIIKHKLLNIFGGAPNHLHEDVKDIVSLETVIGDFESSLLQNDFMVGEYI